MDLRFDDDEESFRMERRRLATRTLAPHYQSDDKTAEFRRGLALDMAGTGLTGLRIPEEHGGQDVSAVVAGLAAEEVGRADPNPAAAPTRLGRGYAP